eukprot:1465138-Rhodomonas_salina.2
MSLYSGVAVIPLLVAGAKSVRVLRIWLERKVVWFLAREVIERMAPTAAGRAAMAAPVEHQGVLASFPLPENRVHGQRAQAFRSSLFAGIMR